MKRRTINQSCQPDRTVVGPGREDRPCGSRRWQTVLVLSAFGLGLGLAAPAGAVTMDVEIRNQTSDTIYVVTAFASELVANNRNLTRIPLPGGSSRRVTVFDDYNKCIFTFTFNFNRPVSPGQVRRGPAKPFRVVPDLDLCRSRTVTVR